MNKPIFGFLLFILFLYIIYYKYFYIRTIKNTNSLLVLVNKKNKLPNNYIPNNLEKINITCAFEDKQLQGVARLSFEQLCNDAKLLGYKITAVSAYRDYNYQKKLYNNYIVQLGKKRAKLSSAEPGHSEHQTGLAIDVMGSNDDYNLFDDCEEFNWMQKNAHKYGFILRYPKDKQIITGFKYEPWHYRYVGIDHATIIYDQNITLEEYIKQNK